MLLILYGLLALLPLLGIVWMVLLGSISIVNGAPSITVDGLFTSLICLTISGIFGTTALFELRKGKLSPTGASASGGGGGTGIIRTSASASAGGVQHGTVESVQFFESHVGQPNQSIVTLRDGADSSRLLVFEGDVRNALPVGKRVKIYSQPKDGRNVIQDVQYA
jgi:hypothetical protein